MKNYFYSFLFIWLLGLHFLAYENPRTQKFISYFKPDVKTKVQASDIKEDYDLILEFIEAYYPLDEESDSNTILSKVESLVESSAKKRILEGYRENLDFLIEKKAKRSFNLEKILRKKNDGKYVVYLNMKKSLNGSKNFPHLLKVVFDLKKEASMSSSTVKIHDFSEFVVTDPTQELVDKTLVVENDVTTNLDLPCKTDALSLIKNEDQVEYKVLPSGRMVSFNPSKDFEKEAVFKAICGRRSFKIKLVKNDDYSTLYQKFEDADGVYRPRKLTKDEQLAKDIEKEFGGELIR